MYKKQNKSPLTKSMSLESEQSNPQRNFALTFPGTVKIMEDIGKMWGIRMMTAKPTYRPFKTGNGNGNIRLIKLYKL